MYLGDFRPSAPLDTSFLTAAAATGAPTTLGGSPVVSIYKDNSATQSTAGVTLTVDFDGVTGLNHLRVDLSADTTFYAAGSSYRAVITTGTVGGTSAIGYVVAEFSIHARGAQRVQRIEAQRKAGVALGSTPNKKIRFQLVRSGGGGFLTSAEVTLVSGDVMLSKNNGAQNPVAVLPTYSNGAFELELSGTELTTALATIRIADTAPKVFDDVEIIIETVGAGGMYPDDPFTASTATPGNFDLLQIDGSGRVTLTPTTIGAVVTAIDASSTQLAAILTAIANVATAVGNINNLSALANLIGPVVLEIPDSGTKVYQYKLVVKTAQGVPVALDASPTLALVNAAGTDRSGGLSSITNPSTGVYVFTYTVAAGATEEGLQLAATGAVGGSPRRADAGLSVVDYDTMTAINSISTNLSTLIGRVGTPSSGTIASGVAAIPTTAAPTAAAIRTEIDSNSTRLSAIDTRLPAAPANQTVLAAAIAAVQSSVNALAGMGAGLTSQDVQDAATLAIISKMTDLADALLDRNMALGTDSGTETVRTVRQALRALRNRQTATAIYKEDDASVSWTQALQTDPNAVPVIGMNPTGGG